MDQRDSPVAGTSQVMLFAQGTITYPPELGIPPLSFELRATPSTIQAHGLVSPPPGEALSEERGPQ